MRSNPIETLTSGHDSPESPAFHRDGSRCFVNWLSSSILRLSPVAPRGQVTEFARLADPPGPDGMAFDAAGNLYVAHYNAERVDVFDPTDREVERIAVPGSGVTNVALGGRDGRDLVITEVATASVYRTRVDV